jgi:spore germination protein YaaH
MAGVDVISPTWFSLNINGIVINESDFRYMKAAHEKGYEVWGLFSNSFKPEWTSEMLSDETYRKKTIAQIAFYSALYDLDGINIDFENMYLDDQDKFTTFVSELYSVLQEQNVVTSIDVTVPGGSDQWSKVYDRLSLAKHVDYVMLMAYDEFWASSPVSGPVASIPWVEKGVRESLELIPNEKLILGVPLYMRVWIESGGSVTSKAIGIKHLEDLLEEVEYTLEYDEENFLNYISYRSDGKLHRIWIEDEESLRKRFALMNKYNLPGVGFWSREFIENNTWETIKNLLD